MRTFQEIQEEVELFPLSILRERLTPDEYKIALGMKKACCDMSIPLNMDTSQLSVGDRVCGTVNGRGCGEVIRIKPGWSVWVKFDNGSDAWMYSHQLVFENPE